MVHKQAIHNETKLYQPNKVLYQCGSSDITQSQAIVELVTAQIIKNIADQNLVRKNHLVVPSKSSFNENLRNVMATPTHNNK